MSIKLMSDDRQEFLVKCAERSIELMNVGVEPNAALTKIAKEAELNTKEVALVSHAINNSKTLSVLANSKAEDKDKPFQITNAEVVNGNLYESDPLVKSEAKAKEKDQDKAEDAKAGQILDKNKKEAADLSRIEMGHYLDADPIDHASTLRQAMGRDNVIQVRVKTAARVNPDTFKGEFTIEQDATQEGDEVTYREVGNPYSKLAGIRIQIEEASLVYTKARQEALNAIEKLAHEFRRMDAPAFARVETIAKMAGCEQDGLDVIYDMCELQKFGHKRAGEIKIAGEHTISQREAHLSSLMCCVDESYKKSANALTVKDLLQEEYQVVQQQIAKHAAAKSDKAEPSNKEHPIAGTAKDIGVQVGNLSQAAAAFPDQLSGAAYHGGSGNVVDLLQSATGDYSKEGPEFPTGDKSPMNVGLRQQLNSADTRGKVDQLLQDEFVRNHPIQDVVAAYNRALSVNPNLGHAELAGLVKQDLAAGGAVPLDTLLRTSTSHPTV